MSYPTPSHAAVLAATEVIPADWRDLAGILQRCGGPEALLSRKQIDHGHDTDLLEYLRRAIDPARVSHWQVQLERIFKSMPDVQFLTIDHKDYPANLRSAHGSPPFIFVRGELRPSDRNSLAIVGSRNATAASLATARIIAGAAAKRGITVISGMARGIDSDGQRAALQAGGRTIGVIAAGIDHVLNNESDRALADMIPDSGAIISQFRPGSPPVRSAFLQRNGVISGLSLVSLIVEAGARSGTRNEAEHALRQGRRILFWAPNFDYSSWVSAYAADPLVKRVETEEQILNEVFTAAQKMMI